MKDFPFLYSFSLSFFKSPEMSKWSVQCSLRAEGGEGSDLDLPEPDPDRVGLAPGLANAHRRLRNSQNQNEPKDHCECVYR